MFLPRYTIRRLLVFTVLAGLMSVPLSFAVHGNAPAIAFVAAVSSVVLLFAIFAVAFFLSWLVTRVFRVGQSGRAGASPFSAIEPPHEVITPEIIE